MDMLKVTALGGLLGLDATGVGQFMVSRPLVAGALTGWLLGDVALGVTIGVVLTCLNFTFIRHLVQRMLVVHPDKRGATAFFFVPKMAALLVAAALAIFFLPISAIGLGIGFSVFLLSIMVESIRFMTGAALIR